MTSQSTVEAEYRALASVTIEIMWLKYLLDDLHVFITNAIHVFCDNKVVVDIASNPIQHAHTKHIELDYHFICEKCKLKLFFLSKPLPNNNWVIFLPSP